MGEATVGLVWYLTAARCKKRVPPINVQGITGGRRLCGHARCVEPPLYGIVRSHRRRVPKRAFALTWILIDGGSGQFGVGEEVMTALD